MNIEVRGINGDTVSFTFDEDGRETMRRVYSAVAERAKVRIDDIRIFSFRTGERYDMLEPLVNVYRNENGLIGYQVLFKRPKNLEIAKPSARVSAMLKQKEDVNFRCVREYKDYAQIVSQKPPDFEQRVASLCELGFDKSDCESALRMCRYNVERASVLLTDKNWTRGLINGGRYLHHIDFEDEMLMEREMFERMERRQLMAELLEATDNEREAEEAQTQVSGTNANAGGLQAERARWFERRPFLPRRYFTFRRNRRGGSDDEQ